MTRRGPVARFVTGRELAEAAADDDRDPDDLWLVEDGDQA